MRNLFLTVLLAGGVVAFGGCASPAQSYARQHPEMPAAQLQILNTGKIPDGTAVAGMTREQIQLAMGVEPTQYTKVDGQDAWVYVHKRLSAMNITSANDATFSHRDNRNQHAQTEGESHAPDDQPMTRTTIFFQGNVATKAEVINGDH